LINLTSSIDAEDVEASSTTFFGSLLSIVDDETAGVSGAACCSKVLFGDGRVTSGVDGSSGCEADEVLLVRELFGKKLLTKFVVRLTEWCIFFKWLKQGILAAML